MAPKTRIAVAALEQEPTAQSVSSERFESPEIPADQPRQATVDPLDNATTTSLAQAILLMTSELQRRENPSRKAKAKEPDTFDGSDPKKLNNFILLCNLYFRSNPAYDDDANKVTLALSYLRGTALEFFEPSLLDSDEDLDWISDWSAFVRILRTQFGPIDPTADAEDGIDNLKMQDNQKIVKYNVEFNKLAIRTHWDDGVLRHRYYSGLAERIKDIMGQQGKPSTLEDMKSLAHSIDSRYWERLREKSRSGRTKSDNSDKSDSTKAKSDDKKNQASTSGHNHGHNHKDNKSKKQHGNNKSDNKSDKPSSSSGSTSTISDKLGKDGKLLPAERQRRFDNNLCMFCGAPGHTAANCNKSTSSASKAKGRAAQTKEKEKETPSDSKKG
jgi:hypothetical protein